jgi:hypothetical protein
VVDITRIRAAHTSWHPLLFSGPETQLIAYRQLTQATPSAMSRLKSVHGSRNAGFFPSACAW